MAGKEKVDIKRSDDFEEVDAELTRAIEELDFTIGRVSAIFDGTADENGPIAVEGDEKEVGSGAVKAVEPDVEAVAPETTDVVKKSETPEEASPDSDAAPESA